MFYNSDRIIALVPATVVARRRGEFNRDDEVGVSIPCHFEDSRSKVRDEAGAFIRVDAVISASVTHEQMQQLDDGTLVRLKSNPRVYYQILDSVSDSGVFGGARKLDVELRTSRFGAPVRPTEGRTLVSDTPAAPIETSAVDPDEDLIVVEDPVALPPNRDPWKQNA